MSWDAALQRRFDHAAWANAAVWARCDDVAAPLRAQNRQVRFGSIDGTLQAWLARDRLWLAWAGGTPAEEDHAAVHRALRAAYDAERSALTGDVPPRPLGDLPLSPQDGWLAWLGEQERWRGELLSMLSRTLPGAPDVGLESWRSSH